jgi:RNA-directed DNA polymerase
MTTAQAVGAVSREAAEWYAIDWQAINRNVRRLQVRIVQATKESRWGRVRALQRLLTHSYSGKVLAVRRVTENNGKKTPGVDQEIWDTPEKKTQAVQALKRRGYQSQPLRRVYIPKSDGKTMRPLGIPTMKDRAQQALYLLALAPVVETTADKNSYGFRQQRSCADAMEQCFKALRSANTQWILEGDIKSCFDKISHDWLLAHVPMDRVILQKWLKSGYMEKHVLHETADGTPQGGIISPALANCALDGLERLLQENVSSPWEVKNPVSISSVTRMTSSSLVNRKNYWKEKSSPWSSSSCKNEVLNSLRRRPSLRTWSTALISSDKMCAGIPTGNCSSNLPRRMLEPS